MAGTLKSEGKLIEEGKITDQEVIANYYKKQDTIKALRDEYCFKRAHAVECAEDRAFANKGNVEEALEWLRVPRRPTTTLGRAPPCVLMSPTYPVNGRYTRRPTTTRRGCSRRDGTPARRSR